MRELTFHNKWLENEIRKSLKVYDGPITDEDALKVTFLDLSQVNLEYEDSNTLTEFKNLEELNVVVQFEDMSFLSKFNKIKTLDIEFAMSYFDVKYLVTLKELEEVFISGGLRSNFIFVNFECIAQLPKLKLLHLHEFGSVDLAILKEMPYLTTFFCGYAEEVKNIDAISYLHNLEDLTLIDVTIQNLELFRPLKDEMHLDICGLNIIEDVDLNELSRFRECEVCENTVNGVWVP